MWRYVIEAESKLRIFEELQLLKIDRLSLFPELPNVAHVIMEDMT